MPHSEIQEVLIRLDKRADQAAKKPVGRNFARTLRVAVSEIRIELGIKEPKT